MCRMDAPGSEDPSLSALVTSRCTETSLCSILQHLKGRHSGLRTKGQGMAPAHSCRGGPCSSGVEGSGEPPPGTCGRGFHYPHILVFLGSDAGYPLLLNGL